MLDRKTLKAKAKEAFKANYWRCVAVALIMTIIVGGGVAGGKNRVEKSVHNSESFFAYDYNRNGSFEPGELRDVFYALTNEIGEKAVFGLIFAVAGVLTLIVSSSWLISALIIEPLSLGCKYFFTCNSVESAKLGEIERGFTPAWWHNVLTLFLTRLFTALWLLLFVIPGVVKTYSYRLVPYLQAENPNLYGTEAITLSRRMMDGHKWEAFVFDLSFIGWYLLVAVTAGITGILWVAPYKAAADAELYRAIRDEAR